MKRTDVKNLANIDRYLRQGGGSKPAGPGRKQVGRSAVGEPTDRAPEKDEVDQAVASIGRAVDRLVRVLGCGDPARTTKALLSLDDLGDDLVVRSLVKILGRSRSTIQRQIIAVYLETFRCHIGSPIVPAVTRAMFRDPNLDPSSDHQMALRSQIHDLITKHRADRRGSVRAIANAAGTDDSWRR